MTNVRCKHRAKTQRIIDTLGILLFLSMISLNGCLNSSSNSGGSEDSGTTDGVTAVSPTRITLKWSKAPVASFYKLFYKFFIQFLYNFYNY